MKTFKSLLVLGLIAIFMSACSSVKVASDFDRQASFNEYKSFAFFKPGIDKAEISDLDKKRILRAINNELIDKGYSKSEKPDLLVSIFTEETQRVSVYNNFGPFGGFGFGGFGGFGFSRFGFGGFGFFNPYFFPFGGGFGFGNGFSNAVTRVEGTIYIDIIDARTRELIWQGKGTGILTNSTIERKEARINKFVSEILEKYPPDIVKLSAR